MHSIADNIRRVRDEIEAAAKTAGRDPSEITLLAVTKTRTAEQVTAAVRAGITDLGENRVQEAAGKIPLVSGPAVWRLIGTLQSNKAGIAAGLFDWVDSVHSKKIADALSVHASRTGKILRVLVQVNISGEESKSGVEPEAVEELVRYADGLPGLEVRGLMTIGSLGAAPSETRSEFRRMRALFERLRDDLRESALLDVLSMGMSGDYPVAVEEGATMVRVGSALFGERV